MELVALQQSGTLGALSSLAQRGLMQVSCYLSEAFPVGYE